MTARQTIIRVRGDETDLSAAVASVIRPDDLARGRRAAKRATNSRTSFCPICGGNKGRTAMRCGDCRNRAMSAHAIAARQAGHLHATGATGASRSLIREAVIRDNPDHGDYQPQSPNWSHRVRGEGQSRTQAWDRKILVGGVWIAESQTPEGIERRRTDDEALRRLAAVTAREQR